MCNIRAIALLSALLAVCYAHFSYGQYPRVSIHGGGYPMRPQGPNPPPVFIPGRGIGSCAGCACCKTTGTPLTPTDFERCMHNCLHTYRVNYGPQTQTGTNTGNSGNINGGNRNGNGASGNGNGASGNGNGASGNGNGASGNGNGANGNGNGASGNGNGANGNGNGASGNGNGANGNGNGASGNGNGANGDRYVNAYPTAPAVTTTLAPVTATPAPVTKCVCFPTATTTTTTAAPVPCTCTYVTAPVTKAPCHKAQTTTTTSPATTTTNKPCTPVPIPTTTVSPRVPCNCPDCNCDICKDCTEYQRITTRQTPSPTTASRRTTAVGYPSTTPAASVTTRKNTGENYGTCCSVTVTGNKAVISCNCHKSESQTCESAAQSNQCSSIEIVFNRVFGYAQAGLTMSCDEAVRQGIVSDGNVRDCHRVTESNGNGNGNGGYNNYETGNGIEVPKDNAYNQAPASSSVAAGSLILSAVTVLMAFVISY